jgi:hypothetical protein
VTTPPLVLVEWNDHCESDGNVWMTAEDAAAADVARCRSVGWLMHHDAERVVLSSSRVDDEDTFSRPFVIVTAAVRRIIPLMSGAG